MGIETLLHGISERQEMNKTTQSVLFDASTTNARELVSSDGNELFHSDYDR